MRLRPVPTVEVSQQTTPEPTMPTNHLAKIKNSANLGLWASAAYCRNQGFPLEMALFVLLGIKSERTLIYPAVPGLEVVEC